MVNSTLAIRNVATKWAEKKIQDAKAKEKEFELMKNCEGSSIVVTTKNVSPGIEWSN